MDGDLSHCTGDRDQDHPHGKEIQKRHGKMDGFRIGKGVRQGCILSPCSFSLYPEYILRNAGLEETQAGKIYVHTVL